MQLFRTQAICGGSNMPSAPCSLSSWSFNPTCQCGLAVHLLTFCSKFYESVRWMASVYCLSDISRQSGAEKVLIIRPLKFIECNILSQTTCPDVTLSQTTCPVHQSADHQHHRLQSAVMLHTMVSLSSPSTKGLVLPSSGQGHCQDGWHPPQ